MSEEFVPDIVISRIPWYLQTLNQMAREGYHTVSSKMLSERLGITAAQIRKDLSFFGGFGKQGTGYKLFYLIEQLQSILNLDRTWSVVLVGAGDLGSALAHYQGFADRGIEIVLMFDNDSKKIGTRIGQVQVFSVDSMEAMVAERDIKIAILTVPAQAAQEMAERLVSAGVQAILSYAPVTLMLPEHVHVQYIDPVLHLQRMMYYLGED